LSIVARGAYHGGPHVSVHPQHICHEPAVVRRHPAQHVPDDDKVYHHRAAVIDHDRRLQGGGAGRAELGARQPGVRPLPRVGGGLDEGGEGEQGEREYQGQQGAAHHEPQGGEGAREGHDAGADDGGGQRGGGVVEPHVARQLDHLGVARLAR
jgi:hypothetical protein